MPELEVAVTPRAGERARRKRIAVDGLAPDELERRLRAMGAD